ncbi:MAG TPA: hypothetical protein DD761_00890, partial [Cyanobacteria bacterium UBA11691]|nr:hypothetical protein [Cyanobacteria bacterium UBA11691]
MVNIGLNPGAMLGVVLFGAGAGLYFLRSVRPELARKYNPAPAPNRTTPNIAPGLSPILTMTCLLHETD